MAAGPLVPALLCELQGVLQPAAPRQDEGVLGVVVTLARHTHATQPVVLYINTSTMELVLRIRDG
jgi:hypothetical protein